MKRLLPGVCLLVGASLSAGARADVVFENMAGDLHNNMPLLPAWLNESAEAGDDVWLAGSARQVTQLDLIFNYRGTIPGTIDLKLRFRDIVEFQEIPGDVLYDSGFLPSIPIVAGLNFYSFQIPNVVVPGHFVWTVEANNRQGCVGELGPAYFNPANIGFSDDFIWISDHGSEWIAYTWGGDPYANFAARITAVPEPTMGLAVGLAAMVACRRRRR